MKKKRNFFVQVLRFIVYAHLFFWTIIATLCLFYNFINPPITPLMIQRKLIRGYECQPRKYIPLEEIPKSIVRMTIIVEDANYYHHFGFDWDMIKKAWEKNKKSGKIRYGASTISNQVARTIFLTTNRNVIRKYLEAQVTVIMELLMTKDRMLELYLNYVEWGKGIYGIETASYYYYGTSCRNLSKTQAMKLVSILSNPIDYTPQTYYRSPSARARYNMLQRYF